MATLSSVVERLPPIVLIVDDDTDIREMYVTYFESSGMWAAAASDPGEAMEIVDELKPDVIVTDLGFDEAPLGSTFVHELRTHDDTRSTPVVVITGLRTEHIPAQTRREADLLLVKPVLAEVLVARVAELAARAKVVRQSSEELRQKSIELTQRANAIVSHVKRLGGPAAPQAEDTQPANRPCPKCSKKLEWLERGSIGGSEYDYYRWCLNGCGLYCYDRRAAKWVKLA